MFTFGLDLSLSSRSSDSNDQATIRDADVDSLTSDGSEHQRTYHFQGSMFRGYNETRTHVYSVQSHLVEVTKGSLEFVADYHVHGLNSAKQFLVCDAFFRGTCRHGSQCARMHFPASVPREVHYKVPPVPFASYDRLRRGLHVVVSEVGQRHRLTQYRSEDCLVTKGSAHYVDQWAVSGVMPKHKLQVCTHFERDGFCPYGKECNFIHPVEAGVATSDAELRQQSHSNCAGYVPNFAQSHRRFDAHQHPRAAIAPHPNSMYVVSPLPFPPHQYGAADCAVQPVVYYIVQQQPPFFFNGNGARSVAAVAPSAAPVAPPSISDAQSMW